MAGAYNLLTDYMEERMRKCLYLFLAVAVLLLWTYAAVAQVPAEVQTLLDKTNSGVQLSPAEKETIADYFAMQNPAPPPGGGTDNEWGPDGFGYTALDPANGGEAFNWLDITTTGTEIWAGTNQDDTWLSGIPMGMTFPFYGTNYTTCDVSANVLMSFGATLPSYNQPLPGAYLRICPWNQDMYHRLYSHYYYKAFNANTADVDTFVVSFHDADYYSGGGPAFSKTLQVVLWSDGRVKFQFDSLYIINPGTPTNDLGIDDAGANGLSVGRNVYDGYAISFYPPPAPAGIYLNNPQVSPAIGTTATNFTYSVLYKNTTGTAPTTKNVYIDGSPFTMTDPGGNYVTGVTMTYITTLTAGAHNYYFDFGDGTYTKRAPLVGTYTGPTVYAPFSGNYDIGGGANNFPTPVAAVAALTVAGLGGPVTFSIYNGTYNAQINLPNTIAGLSATNTLTFQPGPSQAPVITSTAGHGFYITGADYITIRGLTITNCYYNGIYNYYTGTDSAKFNRFLNNRIYNVGTAGSYSCINLYYSTDTEVNGNEINGDNYGLYVYYSRRNLIANNMIFNTGTYGIYAYYGDYNNYYHNTLYVTTTYGLYKYYGTYINVVDNIIYHGGTGSTLYGFYMVGAPATQFTTSNYNDLYAPTANVGYYTAAQPTLAAWRTATLLDANSISANPGFYSTVAPYNFHIITYLPSPVDNVGTPLAAVTTDFDGEPRSGTTPDIGADEFTYTPLDYCVDLTPRNLTQRLAPTQFYNYSFNIFNCGTVNDTYNLALTVTGQPWPHQIRDNTGTTVIDSIQVTAGATNSFVVRVQVSAGAVAGTQSVAQVVATSRYGSFRNILTDTSYATTTASLGGNYDIGGGANNYPDLVSAATALSTYGVGLPVNFNIYTGTYNGQVNLPNTIPGMGASNPIVFRPAAGQSPVVTSTSGHGFYITGADYITIRGLTITNCYYNGIYNYYTGTDSAKFNRFISNHIYNVGTYSSYSGIYMYMSTDCEVRGNEIQGDYYGLYVSYSRRNLIANNMIYGTGYSGIYLNYGDYNDVYYNSVLTSTTYGFYKYYGTYTNVVDNIFYQAGSGSLYAYYLAGAPGTQFLTSNYNDLYAPTAYVGYYSAAQTTLANWQTATGVDLNSISADPGFTSLTDTPNLHINVIVPSPVDGVAIPIPAVTTDFDGQSRDALTPDIGADEFTYTPPNYYVDVEPEYLLGYVAPGDSLDYLFRVSNVGEMNDTYDLTATVTEGENWTYRFMDKTGTSVITSIAVNSDVTDTFLVRVLVDPAAETADYSLGRIVAESQSIRDVLSDTAQVKTYAVTLPIPLDYFENFDSWNGYYTSSNPSVWQWGTPTYVSGPPAAYSPPNCWGTVLGGQYPNSTCETLTSPPIDLDAGALLTFRHWYSTETSFDGGNVWISTDNGLSWILLTPVGGYPTASVSNTCTGSEPVYSGTSAGWVLATFDLSPYAGETVMLRWKFGSDSSVQYPGWYIDDVTVARIPPGSVAGRITLDGAVGNITDVIVEDGIGESTNPNSSGDYVLGGVPAGLRNITARLDAFFYPQTVTGVTVVGNDTTFNVDMTLRRLEPTVPTGFAASVEELTGAVTLTWDAYPDPSVDIFLLQRRSATPPWVDLPTVPASQLSYVDSLPAEGVYLYHIAAADTDVVPPPSQSDWSDEVTVTWGELPPQNCQAFGNYDDQIRVTWSAPGILPNPPVELYYDDGVAETWYVVSNPNGAQDYFAVRFTIPPTPSLTPPIQFPRAAILVNDIVAFTRVMVCPTVSGVPDIANPLITVLNVAAPAALDWAVADFGDFALPTTDDFWVVMQFPSGLYGPGVGADATSPDLRSYWSNVGTWNQWAGHDWIVHSFLGEWTDGSLMSLGPSGWTTGPDLPIASTAVSMEKGAASMGQVSAPFAIRAPQFVGSASNQSITRFETDQALEYYKIYRDGAFIDTSYGLEYFDTGLAENIDHDYYVTGYYDNDVESDPSDTATAACNMAPAAPANFTGTPTPAEDGMILTWDDPTLNVDGSPCVDLAVLSIYRDADFLADVSPGVETYTDYPPSLTTFYTWTIIAKDEVPNQSQAQYRFAVQAGFSLIPYSWVEIAGPAGGPGTNTGLIYDDQNLGPFSIGFSFPFYGCELFSSLRVCSNGFASFTSTATSYTNYAIPNTAEPNNLLAMYWDDMNVSAGGSIWYYYDSVNGRFIVEFYQVPHYSTGGSYTFEAILYPDGSIEYMYNTITHGTPNSCTVGIENGTGTAGLQCAYDLLGPLFIASGMGIRIETPCEAYCVNLEPEFQSSEMSPGDTVDYPLTATNCGSNTDVYDLSVANLPIDWTGSFFDATGLVAIDSVGPLDGNETADFIFRLSSPVGEASGAYTANAIASSRYGSVRNTLADTVQVQAALCGVYSLPYSEDFEYAGADPPCWTIVDGGSMVNGSGTWHAELYDPANPALGWVMISDSDGEGSANTQDEQLISPTLDCSGVPAVFLSYWYYFYQYAASVGAVDISISGGAWQNIVSYTIDGSGTVVHNISAWAANQSDVRIRFHYTAAWDFWWVIDSVRVYEGVLWADAATTCIRVTPAGTVINDGAKKMTGASYNVYATVENFGTMTGNVTVNAMDDLGWASTTTIVGMVGGTCQEVLFPIAWLGGGGGGANTMTVFTVMAGDTIPGNNTATKSVTVPGADGDTLRVDDGTNTYANAWYFYDVINVMATEFTPTLYPAQINWLSAWIIGPGSFYWPWPDATTDQYWISIWLEDPMNPGYPAEPPVWTEHCMYSSGVLEGWAYVAPDEPIMVGSGSFWIGVQNPAILCASVGQEGLAMDAASNFPLQAWYREAGVWYNTDLYAGDDMVRANVSAALEPVLVTIRAIGANAVLDWASVPGAVEYKIYKASTVGGTYALIDSTSGTQYVDIGAVGAGTKSFYYVTADNVARDFAVSQAPAIGPVAVDRAAQAPSYWDLRKQNSGRPLSASTIGLGAARETSGSRGSSNSKTR